MTGLILLMCLAPAAIAAGLILLKSAGLTFLLFHGGVCLGLPVSDVCVHRIPAAVFLKNCGFRFNRKTMLFSLMWGVVLFAVVFLLFSLLRERIWDSTGILLVFSEWGINRMNPVLFVSMMVIGNAFLEEFFWRGYVVYKLSAFLDNRGVILVSAAFYTSYHAITTGVLFSLPYAAVSTVSVFVAGVVWGIMRVKTDSILFPVITHLFADLAIMGAYLAYLA